MNQPVFQPVIHPKEQAPLDVQYTKDHIQHPNVEIGDYTYGIPAIRWLLGEEKVRIGKFVSIAHNVNILMAGNHALNVVSSYPFARMKNKYPKAQGKCPVAKGDVNIGNDVWIGMGALILSGVTIGDGAIIGARAVVAKDIPPYGIAVGNPAEVVKKRFDNKTVEMLLRVQWWDWDEEKIRRNADVLSGTDVSKIEECV